MISNVVRYKLIYYVRPCDSIMVWKYPRSRLKMYSVKFFKLLNTESCLRQRKILLHDSKEHIFQIVKVIGVQSKSALG